VNASGNPHRATECEETGDRGELRAGSDQAAYDGLVQRTGFFGSVVGVHPVDPGERVFRLFEAGQGSPTGGDWCGTLMIRR
jgi:hypothetical protein